MTVIQKIETAQALFAQWEKALWAEAGLRRLLETLQEKAAASTRVSRELGVVAACKRCDEEDGGSCCGAGIEERYSPQLLLINLLLDRPLPTARRFADSCYFLGTDGCALIARDILCINYLCATLQHSLAHEDLVRLQTVTGAEMETLFRTHETVTQFLKAQGLLVSYTR